MEPSCLVTPHAASDVLFPQPRFPTDPPRGGEDADGAHQWNQKSLKKEQKGKRGNDLTVKEVNFNRHTLVSDLFD